VRTGETGYRVKFSILAAEKTKYICRRLTILTALSFGLAACAHRVSTNQPPAPAPVPQPQPTPAGPPAASAPVVPGEYVEEGVASWYGNPFDGRKTSNGEIYDMHAFTAAHRTLPFGAVVRVTNLANGKQTEIRVNDRGPFVANRIIDLSQAAAQAIEMIGTGTAMVRLEVIAGPNPLAGSFAVQVGAFLMPENADRLKAQLAANYSSVQVVPFVLPTGRFYRVRVGRVSSEAEARQLESRLHDQGQTVTFVVRLDD
jgi:rare lipoprotein A